MTIAAVITRGRRAQNQHTRAARDAIAGYIALSVALIAVLVVRAADAGEGPRSDGLSALVTLSALGLIFGGLWGYLALGNWMSDALASAASRGENVPAPWNAWVAWFIPLYNIVMPYVAMGRLAKGAHDSRAGVGAAAWWAGLVLAVVAERATSGGEANGSSAWAIVGAIALIVSIAGLVTAIRPISSHLDTPPSGHVTT